MWPRWAEPPSRRLARRLLSSAAAPARGRAPARWAALTVLAAGTGLYCAARSSVLWSQGAPTDPTTVAGEDAGVAARTPGGAGPYYAMEEVAWHCRPDDMWVVIDGEVYDVTQWLASHPGGSGVLCAFAGQDVSREYAQLKHSCDASAIRAGLHIGTVRDYRPPEGLPPSLRCPAAAAATGAAAAPKQRLVIVGAGICGVSAAYHLSQDPAVTEQYDIAVVDRGWMVGGTALKSSAIMFAGPLLEQRRENKEAVGLGAWLGQMSYEMAAQMQREWEDVSFSPRPMLGLCFSEAELAMARRSKTPRDTVLTPDEARAAEPLLQGNTSLVGALLKPGCFTVDPFLVCNAYAKRAAQAGVKFLMGTEILHIERDSSPTPTPTASPFQIHVADGPAVPADVVLLCAGAADAALAKPLGHDVAVRPMHGQMYAVRLPASVPEMKHIIFSYEGPHYWAKRGDGANCTLDSPTLERRCHHIYGLQVAKSDGVCKFGGDRVEGDYAGEVFAEGLLETKARVEEIFPTLQGSGMVGRGWGGTMPFTPDQNIIVGQVSPDLFVCTGAPFTKGAAAGMLLAVDVATKLTAGATELPDRSGVARPELLQYLHQCRPQRFDAVAGPSPSPH